MLIKANEPNYAVYFYE